MDKKELSKRMAEEFKAKGVKGKGTVAFLSKEEFKKLVSEFRRFVSPSYAADRLKVSRSYIKQLEKEGKIRVYRVRSENINWTDFPMWAWFIVPPKKKLFVFIPEEDIENRRKEMIKKAEERVKQLSKKK